MKVKMGNKHHLLMKSYRFICLSLIFLSLMTSCTFKHSYKRDELVPSIKQILKNEFDIDAMVKLNGQTIGFCITVPGLFSPGKKVMPIAIDYLNHVRLALRRVLFSTKENIEFFQMNLRGDDSAIEFTFQKKLADLKKFMFLRIAMSDYQKRMSNDNISNVSYIGQKKIKSFIDDLSSKTPQSIIHSHFSYGLKLEFISKSFINWLWEAAMKKEIENKIVSIQMAAHEVDRYYFYVKVKESFKPKHGFEQYEFSTHSGEVHAYLIEVESPGIYNARFKNLKIIENVFLTDEFMDLDIQKDKLSPILVKHGIIAEKEIISPEFKKFSSAFDEDAQKIGMSIEQIYQLEQMLLRHIKRLELYYEVSKLYGYPHTWPENDFYVRDINMPSFIIEQIASRIITEIVQKENKDKKTQLIPRITHVKGEYLKDKDQMRLIFFYRDRKTDVEAKDLEISKSIAQAVKKSYELNKLDHIEIGTLYGSFSKLHLK